MDILKAEIERKRKQLEEKNLVVSLIQFLVVIIICLFIPIVKSNFPFAFNFRVAIKNSSNAVIYWHKKGNHILNHMVNKMKMHRHRKRVQIHVRL